MSPKDNPTDEAPEVLIVENSPTQALKLRHLLGQQGFQTISARNAQEALAALERHAPFLVLSDTVLPSTDGYELCRQIKAKPEMNSVLVVLMASLSDPQAILRLLECGADNVLPKPYDDDILTTRLNDIWATEKLRRRVRDPDMNIAVYGGKEQALPQARGSAHLDTLLSLFEIGASREQLLQQFREALDRLGEEPSEAAPALPPTASTPPAPSLHILLAEDSDVNQRLGVRTLEKNGHTVAVASDGRQALSLLDHEPFDLILMDVEMPEMDGLEATAAIRNREKSSGAHLPIIAMTAHTDTEDLERCLAAGMDDYISKPLQMEMLAPMLARLPRTASPSSLPAIWNREAALATVEGDGELLGEIIGLFLEEAPRLLESIHDALVHHDEPTLERAAHSLKGAAASLCAEEVVAAALSLETLSRAGQVAQVQEELPNLEAALHRLTPLLESQA